MPNPDIGKFRHRVTLLQRKTGPPTRNGSGKESVNYVANSTFWAAIEPLKGAELFSASQLKATTFFKITLRNPSMPIRPGDQLRFESTARLFTVDTCYRADELNAFLIITATELLP